MVLDCFETRGFKLEKFDSLRLSRLKGRGKRLLVEHIGVSSLLDSPKTKGKKSCLVKKLIIVGILEKLPSAIPARGMERQGVKVVSHGIYGQGFARRNWHKRS